MSTRILIVIYLIVTLLVCLRVMKRQVRVTENSRKVAIAAVIIWIAGFAMAYTSLIAYGLLSVVALAAAPKAIDAFSHSLYGDTLKGIYIGWWLSLPVGFYYLAT